MKYIYKYENHNEMINDISRNELNVSGCINESHIHYVTDTFDAIVEYLSTTGGGNNVQCFDTGVYAADDIGVYCKMTANDNTDTYLFGNYYADKRYSWGHNSNGWYYGWGDYYPKATADRYKGTTAVLKLNWLNDHKWYSGDGGNTNYKGGNLSTLGFTQPDTIKFLNHCKVYFFKVSKGNEIIHDFIPVRKNGIGYFYDKITYKLYANINETATVTIGPDIFDYKVKYLKATSTQYINTGIIVSNNISVQGKMYTTPEINTWLFGGRTSASSKALGLFLNNNNSNIGTFYWYYNNNATLSDNSSIYMTSNYYEFDSTESKNTIKIKINNNTPIEITRTAATFTGDYTMYIFKLNNAGGVEGGGANVTDTSNYEVRLYYFKIYNSNELVRDYIPVSKNGIGYLYDAVTNSLFANSGTGEFTYDN